MAAVPRMTRLIRIQKNLTRLARARLPASRRLSVLALVLTLLLLLSKVVPSAITTGRARHSSDLLLWSTPRTGGFNNQLITIYQAIACARQHGRTLVLPLIYENVRRDTSSKGQGPFPLEDYFDVRALARLVPITTPAQLDARGVPCRRIAFATSSHFMANARRIPRLLKQNYTNRFPLEPHFVDLRAGGKHTPMRSPRDVFDAHEPCVDDSFCSSEEWADFGAYSQYNVSGQGFNMRASPSLRHIRAAFQPSATVSAIADAWYAAMPHPFNALHLRKGDFALKCKELPHLCIEYGEFSFVQSAPFVRSKISRLDQPELPLFISTTHADEVRGDLQESGLHLVFMEDLDIPPALEWTRERVDILSFASQVLASRAAQFVGNRFSSFSTEVNNMRYLRNQSDAVLFF